MNPTLILRRRICVSTSLKVLERNSYYLLQIDINPTTITMKEETGFDLAKGVSSKIQSSEKLGNGVRLLVKRNRKPGISRLT